MVVQLGVSTRHTRCGVAQARLRERSCAVEDSPPKTRPELLHITLIRHRQFVHNG